jgi:PPIC-type PPIASE domain
MRRSFVGLAAVLLALTACDGFKEAMTAHVDVAAKAGSQELSVDRLAQLLSQVKVPVTPDIAKAVTDLWVNYQLIGQAAARGDSLNDPKAIDQALWPIIAQQRAQKWHERIAKNFPGIDTTGAEAKYNQGEMLAARHILLQVPENASPATRDSVRKRAEELRAQATSANFAELARKYSQDPGSAQRGGDLGVFPKGMMVKEFQDALAALKPGEISPVVKTQFGYHIIRRSTYAEAKDEFNRVINQDKVQAADSAYLAKLESSGDVKIKPNAAALIKDASKDLEGHARDNTLIASSKAGDFTVARFVRWLQAFPQRDQIRQGIQTAPDSQVVGFARNIIRNELVLREADSAKVNLEPQEMNELHSRFGQIVATAWDGLGVNPKALADSAKTPAERERVAAAHVDKYLDELLSNKSRYVDVPAPLQVVLRDKYEWKVNQAGLDRAMERAAKTKATADSARAKNRPPSAVPLAPAQPSQQPSQKPSAPQPEQQKQQQQSQQKAQQPSQQSSQTPPTKQPR